MPKKRTYEQLERALKRAKAVSKRTKRAYDSYLMGEAERAQGWRRTEAAIEDRAADRVAEVEDLNIRLTAKLTAETVRADNLYSETEELNDLIRADHERAQEARAKAAETNLAVYQEAFSASSMVSLGLLDLVKMMAAVPPPLVFQSDPPMREAPGLKGYATETPEDGSA